ncbi:NifB/NifX family molybdenum-iron cluster-binding protein [Sulfurovum sp.]|uniref:NifB/NifX family molybdenum-iron cluster-binding protein n=1 Tax=Sulfurovum sp. TaxID=1969726 RepID=UPI002867DFD9|nr:NifB/NifX family molybdenum-iron cluster-binding protein [Sulfurovum sp.]
MKIAIPVKINKKNPAVAPLFGKAKWFAFMDKEGINIKANPAHGGKSVIDWFNNEGVDTIIMQEMGATPYKMIQAHGGIKLYHSGFKRILLTELIEKFADGELEMLTDMRMADIIKHHESRHTHDKGHYHHEHH